MLRIMLHQDSAKCRLELVGRLCGPWVGETERVWGSAQSLVKEIEIDIREVTGIDNAGRDLLATMHQSGAHLIAKGVWMRALVEELTGERPFDGTKRPQPRKELPHNEDF
jgi:hypothetical protein